MSPAPESITSALGPTRRRRSAHAHCVGCFTATKPATSGSKRRANVVPSANLECVEVNDRHTRLSRTSTCSSDSWMA